MFETKIAFCCMNPYYGATDAYGGYHEKKLNCSHDFRLFDFRSDNCGAKSNR